MATFQPINPRTGKPYRDGKARKGSRLGIVGDDGEVKRLYDRPFSYSETFEIFEEEAVHDVRTLDRRVRGLEPIRRIVAVNAKGLEIERPKAGAKIRWAIDDGVGQLWLLQPPAKTPDVPGRSRGKDAEGRVVRGKSRGPAKIKAVQPYSDSARKWMQDSMRKDPMGYVTLFVNSNGIIGGPSRSRHQVALRLDGVGLDTGMHEMLAWVKWSPYELALLKRDTTILQEGEWTDWMQLDAEQSVRDSVGRLSVQLTTPSLDRLRDDPATFMNVGWQCEMRSPNGEVHRLSGQEDVRKDAELLVKRMARSICTEMFKVGFKHTRTSKIKKEDGKAASTPVGRLVSVSPERASKLLRQYTGKVHGKKGQMPLEALEDAIGGKVRFQVNVKTLTKRSYASEFNRTQRRTGYNRARDRR